MQIQVVLICGVMQLDASIKGDHFYILRNVVVAAQYGPSVFSSAAADADEDG
jgi:hypothetical protein